MRRVHYLILGMLGSLLAPRDAQAGLPDCQPGTVIRAAPPERKPILLRAFSFYAFTPDYDQGTCVNTVTGAKKPTDFNAFFGGCDAKDWWRTDCSGFVSSCWDLSQNLSCGTLANNVDSAGHAWHDVQYGQLSPGDALNNPAEHVMLFTGWLDDSHSQMCTVQELNPTQKDVNGIIGCGIWSWATSDLQANYNPLSLDDTARLNPTPDQSTGNDTMTLVNWPDGHAEAFFKGQDAKLYHVFTNGDAWDKPEALDAGAQCGSTVAFWPHLPSTWKTAAEVFSPRAAGDVGHLWWSGGNWNTFSALGAHSLTHLSSVFDFDGNVAVFGLGADGAIYENYGDRWAVKWSDWKGLGGSFATGASAIVWNDGHIELFATGTDGRPAHDLTDATGKWQGWQPMNGLLSSRPVPVRWPDGHVEVFATGADRHLQSSHFDGKQWTDFAVVDGATAIAGEPAPIMNGSGGGAGAGPEVFARTTDGVVVHLWWGGSSYNAFSPHMNQKTTSDPFAWVKRDGTAELFTVDEQNDLVHSHHTSAGWSPWAPIGSGVDACVETAPPLHLDPAVLGALGSDGTGGGSNGAGGGAQSSGLTGTCSCSVAGEGTTPPATGFLAGAVLGLTLARRRLRRSRKSEAG